MTIKDAQFITVRKDKLSYRKPITILKESNISKECSQLCVELITVSHDSCKNISCVYATGKYGI